MADGDWQIEAHGLGAEIRYITGPTSKTDAENSSTDFSENDEAHGTDRSG